MLKKIFTLFTLLFALCFTLSAITAEELNKRFLPYKDEITYDNAGYVFLVKSKNGMSDRFHYSSAGVLESIETFYSNGNVKDQYYFLRANGNGKLLGVIKKNGEDFYIKSSRLQTSYLLTNQNDSNQTVYDNYIGYLLFEKMSDNNSAKTNDDGNIELELDGKTYIYSKDARLLNDGENEYIYDDNKELLQVVKKTDTGKIVQDYAQGSVVKEEEFSNDKLVRRVLFAKDGKVEEYFENGIPYARGKYDETGKKIISIEYL